MHMLISTQFILTFRKHMILWGIEKMLEQLLNLVFPVSHTIPEAQWSQNSQNSQDKESLENTKSWVVPQL